MEIRKTLEDYINNTLLDGHESVEGIDLTRQLNDILDSLSIVQLIVFIEDKFKVSLLDGDVDVDVLNSLDTITEYIEKSMGAKI